MIDRGIKVTYKAQGNLINDRLPGRLPFKERQPKRDRMSARLDARREVLFAARRQLERNTTAQDLRSLRRANPTAARAVVAMRRKARAKS